MQLYNIDSFCCSIFTRSSPHRNLNPTCSSRQSTYQASYINRLLAVVSYFSHCKMSTNSGREGTCERCDHPKDGHARKSESKCKNKACGKQWEICQGGVHGEVQDNLRRICYKPCNCKEKYYPDKVKFALPLAPHEYKIGHPGYRALSQEEEEDDEEEVLCRFIKITDRRPTHDY